jgi:hypothetical protein
LILYRLNTKGVEIFEDLLETSREVVEDYCKSNSIDLLKVCNSKDTIAKEMIGLKIIEINILEGITIKAKKDVEIKQLGLTPYVITNKVEEAPWLKLFNSPLAPQWWTKNTNFIINDEHCKEHPGYEKLVRVSKAIHDQWIRPQEVLPNIEAYNELMSLSVPQEVQDLINFHSGN